MSLNFSDDHASETRPGFELTSVVWPDPLVVAHLERVEQGRDVDVAELVPEKHPEVLNTEAQ